MSNYPTRSNVQNPNTFSQRGENNFTPQARIGSSLSFSYPSTSTVPNPVSFSNRSCDVSFGNISTNVGRLISSAKDLNLISSTGGSGGGGSGTGPQGLQGDIGPQGYQGDIGTNGNNGLQGPQGINGNNGTQGSQGMNGNNGSQGLQGLSGNNGTQGFQGINGTQGAQGLNGNNGTQGVQGWQGISGNNGIQGPQGWQGGLGSTGAVGPQGVGWTGSIGPQGVPGYASGLIQNSQGVIPALSQNSQFGYVVSASSEYSASYPPWKPLGSTPGDWAPSGNGLPLWWQVQLPNPLAIYQFQIARRASNEYFVNFTFNGSNDGTNWTVLKTITGDLNNFPYPGVLTVNVMDPTYTPYSYYRVQAQTTSGINSGIGYFQLYAYQSVSKAFTGATGPIGPTGSVGATGALGATGTYGPSMNSFTIGGVAQRTNANSFYLPGTNDSFRTDQVFGGLYQGFTILFNAPQPTAGTNIYAVISNNASPGSINVTLSFQAGNLYFATNNGGLSSFSTYANNDKIQIFYDGTTLSVTKNGSLLTFPSGSTFFNKPDQGASYFGITNNSFPSVAVNVNNVYFYPTSVKGMTGPTGPNGFQGFIGATGAQGPQGPVPYSSLNYSQNISSSVNATLPTSFPYNIISTTITTSGNPVQVFVSGDANPSSAGGWGIIQLYRGNTGIGGAVQFESSASNENSPYCIQTIDTPPSGTHTYSLKVNTMTNNTQFGESTGPCITAIELQNVRGATGAQGFQGPQGPAGGFIQLTQLADNLPALGGTQIGPQVISSWIRPFNSFGGTLMFSTSFSAFTPTVNQYAFDFLIDGVVVASSNFYFNNTSVHTTIPSLFNIENIPSGAHTGAIRIPSGVTIDVNDHLHMSMIEVIGANSIGVTGPTGVRGPTGPAKPFSGLYRYSTSNVVNPGSYVNAIVKYDTAVDDTTGWYDNTTGRVTPNIAGWYQVSAGARVYAGGSEASFGIRKNGTTISLVGGLQYAYGNASLGVYLNGTTDYLDFISLTQSAVTNTQSQQTSPLTMIYMSP